MNRRITKTTIIMSLAVLGILLFPVVLQPEKEEATDEAVLDVTSEPIAEAVPTQSPSPTAALERFSSPVRRYTRSVVNLRAGPSTDFDTVGSLPANTALDVIGKQGDWYRILVNDREVYVAGWLTRDALSPVSLTDRVGKIRRRRLTIAVSSVGNVKPKTTGPGAGTHFRITIASGTRSPRANQWPHSPSSLQSCHLLPARTR